MPLDTISTLSTPASTPWSTLQRTPPTPPSRTSVGARPDVVAEDAVAAASAADDVDGAGGVDHGRVPISRSPSRLGRAARPRDTCGRTRATTGRSRRTQPRARGRNAGRAINTADARRATGRRTQRRGARARAAIQSDGNAQTHAHALTEARIHARTRAHAHK
jgi:hypothetical protein